MLSVPHSGLCKTLRSRNSSLLLVSCVSDIYHYVAASAIPRGAEEIILLSIYLLPEQAFFKSISMHVLQKIPLIPLGGNSVRYYYYTHIGCSAEDK